jgi:flagellar M-ring protein FliF
VLPQESLFTEQERQAKASVVVKLRGGRLGDDAQEAITHLVASAVDNLKPENVTLINADGGMPILARGGGATSRPRYWAEFETALAQKVIATLEPVVGPGKARANVTVEYDLATSDSTQETYDPNGAVVLTSQSSEERDSEADAEAQGIPGTTANVPGKQPTAPVKAPPPTASESARLRTDNKTFAVSKTVRHTVQPSGALKRLTAAVLVDDATEMKEENGQTEEKRRKRTPEEMKQIEELVTAAIGVDATRGDKVAVANLSFQTLPLEEPAPPTFTERVAPLVDKWINVVRYGALCLLFLLIYMLVLRPIRRQIVATLQALPQQLRMAKATAALKTGGGPGLAGKEAGTPGLETTAPAQMEEGIGEVQQAVQLKKNLLDKVKKEPATASRLIQNWVRQETKV